MLDLREGQGKKQPTTRAHERHDNQLGSRHIRIHGLVQSSQSSEYLLIISFNDWLEEALI